MSSYCVLCGVPILYYASDEWRRVFRAVYTRLDRWDEVCVSGVGLSRDSRSWVPSDPAQRYDELSVRRRGFDVDLARGAFVDVLHPDRRYYYGMMWGFGFHEACWDIFTKLGEPHLPHLFLACLSAPLHYSNILDWGNDYAGGAECTLLPTGRRRLIAQLVTVARTLGLHASPVDIPSIQDIVASTPPNLHEYIDIKGRGLLGMEKLGKDTFECLPTEILHGILLLVPSRDVFALRLASRAFANAVLPEAFWESRFARGHEYHCIDTEPGAGPNFWKQRYLAVRDVEICRFNLKNRIRIWGLASRLQDMLGQMERVSCAGRPLRCFFEHAGDRDGLPWLTATRSLTPPETLFVHGCRALRKRMADVPTPFEVTGFFVSFVQLISGTWVSGLRFVQPDGEGICLGYVHSSREVSVPLQFELGRKQVAKICGFQAAMGPEGIKAVALVLGDETMSPWAGERNGFPVRLLTDNRGSIVALKCEFDAFKLVSLSISTDAMGAGQTLTSFPFRNICIWSPEVPPGHFLFDRLADEYPLDWYYECNEPVITVTFGGPHGEDLGKLAEVAVWSLKDGNIMRVEFRYSDETSPRSLGRLAVDSSIEPEILTIDGPGGERIQDVEVQLKGKPDSGLKIRTNHGRIAVFPRCTRDGDTSWTRIETSGKVIIGLYTVAGNERTILKDRGRCTLGLISIDSRLAEQDCVEADQ